MSDALFRAIMHYLTGVLMSCKSAFGVRGWAALAFVLALAPVLCKGFTNSVGMFFSVAQGESAVMRLTENIVVVNPAKKYSIEFPLWHYVPVKAGSLGAGEKFMSVDIVLNGQFLAIDNLARKDTFERLVLFFRANSPSHSCDIGRGISMVMNCHHPRAVEVSGFGSILGIGSIYSAIGDSVYSATDHICTLGTFGRRVTATHSEIANKDQAISEKPKSNVGDFCFSAENDLRYLYGIVTIGALFCFAGIMFLGRNGVANLFCAALILGGVFTAFYGPSIWNFWLARCLAEQPSQARSITGFTMDGQLAAP